MGEAEGGVARVVEGEVEAAVEGVVVIRETPRQRTKVVATRRGRWAEEIGSKLFYDLLFCLTN